MKILVVSNLFWPDRGGGASVFADLCVGLKERGHEVTVFAAYPYYPEWKNKSGKSLWKVTTEDHLGVTVRRYGLFIPGNPSNLIARLAYEASFALSLLRSIFSSQRYDAVMVFCPVLGAVGYGAIRNLLFREPMWLNVQDIPADAAAASEIGRSRTFQWFGQLIQKRLFNRAKIWSSIAPSMVRRLEGLRTKSQQVLYCPNFLNDSMADEIAGHPAKVGRPASVPIKLLYAGNIGKKQGLFDFCQFLSKTSLLFQFRIHGNGGEAETVRKWVQQCDDSRFEFGEFLDEEGFVAALFETDLFLITEKRGVGASFIPSKLIPCIATGTPVLGICDQDGPLGSEILNFGIGICLPWSSLDSIGDEVRILQSSELRLTTCQQNAINRGQFYSRESVLDTVENGLSCLVEKFE